MNVSAIFLEQDDPKVAIELMISKGQRCRLTLHSHNGCPTTQATLISTEILKKQFNLHCIFVEITPSNSIIENSYRNINTIFLATFPVKYVEYVDTGVAILIFKYCNIHRAIQIFKDSGHLFCSITKVFLSSFFLQCKRPARLVYFEKKRRRKKVCQAQLVYDDWLPCVRT